MFSDQSENLTNTLNRLKFLSLSIIKFQTMSNIEQSGTPETVEVLHGHLTALSGAHPDAVSFNVENGITAVKIGNQEWLVGRAADGWVVFDFECARAEMSELMNALTIATTVHPEESDEDAAATVDAGAATTGAAVTRAL
jgi:hypothetical protein